VRLLLRPAHEVGDAEGRLWFYLGRDAAGTDHLAAADPVPDDDQQPEQSTAVGAGVAGEATRLAGLREIGLVLDDTGAGLVTTAVALSNWHATHTRCPRCGAPTEPEQGGWVRRCTADRTEHYPRTDPAVIVSVTDADDRLLLGRNPGWPEGRFSTLAGFVEPGESIEDAVRREVAEEAGVRVGEVRYLASQPWPFPASLMIGCTALAVDTAITVDGVEITEARWFSRDDLLADCLADRLLIPPGISISRRLVEHWFGGPLPTEGTWR
jgi:NAD+ diphosphatase